MKTFSAGLVIITAAILTGCATNPPAQVWDNRKGHYTEGQAVSEYGPPRKSVALTDGSRVDTWLMRTGSQNDLAYIYPSPTEPYVASMTEFNVWRNQPYIPDIYLRLMFGPDGRLVAWDRPIR